MTDEADPRSVGERIERLLDASAAAGPLARERAEELVRLVAELYASGLERILDIAHDEGALTDEVVARIADDPLVSSLLVVHDLHPYPVEQRLELTVAKLRESTGADIEIVAFDGAVLRLRVAASGCGSAGVEAAVREALEVAAPEVPAIQIETGADAIISLDSLAASLHAPPSAIAGQ